jgi:fibrillarin-like rRNA methylase
MKRLIELSHSEASKIRARQNNGTMSELYDCEKYLCYDEQEYKEWKPKKSGRKPKNTESK